MELLVVSWLLTGGISSYISKQKGRDPIVWFFLGLLFGLFAILALFLLTPVTEAQPSPPKIVPLQESEPDHALVDWFYTDKNHTQQGPVSYHDLMTLWNMYSVEKDSYVWCEGMPHWQRFGEVFNKK